MPWDMLRDVVLLVTAMAAVWAAYRLHIPYVRVAKTFDGAAVNPRCYKVKNAGMTTALDIIFVDRNHQIIELDLALGDQRVPYIDALPPAAEITVRLDQPVVPTSIYYQTLFGWIYETMLQDAGNRFRMESRLKSPTWWRGVPEDVRREMR